MSNPEHEPSPEEIIFLGIVGDIQERIVARNSVAHSVELPEHDIDLLERAQNEGLNPLEFADAVSLAQSRIASQSDLDTAVLKFGQEYN